MRHRAQPWPALLDIPMATPRCAAIWEMLDIEGLAKYREEYQCPL